MKRSLVQVDRTTGQTTLLPFHGGATAQGQTTITKPTPTKDQQIQAYIRQTARYGSFIRSLGRES